MIARAHTFGDADERATVGVANLRLVPHPKNAHTATEVMELTLTPITERAIDRLTLTVA